MMQKKTVEKMLYTKLACEIEEFKSAKQACERHPSKTAIKKMFNILFLISIEVQEYIDARKITRREGEEFLNCVREQS